MVKVRWTQRAVDDLVQIHNYISEESPHYASAEILKILDCEELIRDHPDSGRIVPEIGNASIREIIKGNYRVIYSREEAGCVSILSVFHSSRLLKGIE